MGGVLRNHEDIRDLIGSDHNLRLLSLKTCLFRKLFSSLWEKKAKKREPGCVVFISVQDLFDNLSRFSS